MASLTSRRTTTTPRSPNPISVSRSESTICNKANTAGVGGSGNGDERCASLIASGGGSLGHLHNQNNNKFTFTLEQRAQLTNSLVGDSILVDSSSRKCSKADLLDKSNSNSNSNLNFSSEVLDEMAGDIRLVDGKKPRKLWAQRDRSAMSFHLLQANLAEDGCEHAQLGVAKKLLQDIDSEESTVRDQENLRSAIYWLIKSSEQGNEEATRLLKDCLSSGRGVSGQNILDVKTCLMTPKHEKLTFKAARLLYLKLNNGEEFITTNQILSRLEDWHKSLQDQEECLESLSSSGTETSDEDTTFQGEKDRLALDRFDVAGYDDGNTGELNKTYTLSQKNKNSANPRRNVKLGASPKLSNSDNFEKSDRVCDQEGDKLTLDDLLKTANSFNLGTVPSPTIDRKAELGRYWSFSSRFNDFMGQLLILTYLGGIVSLECFCLYASVLMSVWACYNILVWNRRQANFKDWSDAYNSVLTSKTWSDEIAVNRLLINYLLPYLICLGVCLVTFFIFDGTVPLKVIIGILVIFSIFRGILPSWRPSWRAFLIFCLGSLPTIWTEIVPQIDKLLGANFSESVEYWSLLFTTTLQPYCTMSEIHLVILAILCSSMFWRSKNNLLQETLPEMLAILWTQQTIKSSLQLELNEAVECFVIGSLLTITILVVQSKVNMGKAMFLLIGITCTITLLASLPETKVVISKSNCLSSVNKMFNPLSPYKDITELNLLDWDEYDKHCHRKAWKSVSPAATQLNCFKKYGKNNSTAVRWNGRISVVKIRDLDLHAGSTGFRDISFDINVNIITSDGGDTNTWQSYLPGSETQQNSPATVFVATNPLERNKDKQNLVDHVLNFKSGDRIQFFGILNELTAGSLKPEIVEIHSIKCLDCAIEDNGVEFFIQPRNKEHDGNESGSSELKDYFSLLKEIFLKMCRDIQSVASNSSLTGGWND